MPNRKHWVEGSGKSKGFSLTGSVNVKLVKSGYEKDEVTGRVLKKGDTIKVSRQVADIFEKQKIGYRVKR